MAKPTITAEQLDEYFDSMDDSERAKLAAELLNDTSCDKDVFKTFFNTLDDACHGELVCRAEEQNSRE